MKGAVEVLMTELGVVLRLLERRASRPLPFPFVAGGGMMAADTDE
ncbi:MAG: hypothetical protein ACJ788_19785 [Ktedonobacteraceae bacterium]